jgi:OmpA-OmpF porin, OOP family
MIYVSRSEGNWTERRVSKKSCALAGVSLKSSPYSFLAGTFLLRRYYLGEEKQHLSSGKCRTDCCGWSRKMTNFDDLTEDIAAQFGLGPEGDALVQEVLHLIAAQPGGVGGLQNKFLAAGLDDKVASWQRGLNPMALSVREVKEALGAGAVKGMAQKVGLPERFTARVLGYGIPKIIVWLKDGGTVPEAISATTRSFVRPAKAPTTQPPAEFLSRAEGRAPQPRLQGSEDVPARRLVLPGAALVITLGLFGYAIITGTAGNQAPALQSTASVAQNSQAASPGAASTPPAEPSRAEGRSVAPGTAASAAKPAAVPGDFSLQVGWIKNLEVEFNSFGGDASQMLFAANRFEAQETMPQASTADTIGSLPFTHLPQFVVASVTGSGPTDIETTLSPMLASAAPGKEQAVTSIEAALQSLAIDFPPNSARIPRDGIPVLRRAAEMIKQLPAGSVVELNGYTHGAANPALNMKLSERRAESVRQALVHEGVSPAMLRAKGAGSASLLASTSTTNEGRSMAMEKAQRSDRRVEFRVVQQQ